MEKYKKCDLFAGKERKRLIIEHNIKTILSFGDKGCVVSLSGPSPEIVYHYLKPLLKKKSQLLLAEHDAKMVEDLRLRHRTEQIKDGRLIFRTGDVFKEMRRQYETRQGWEHKHVLFDLDFCDSARTLLRDTPIFESLKWLAKSNLPRKEGFWISITTCQRGDFNADWMRLQDFVRRTFWTECWNTNAEQRNNYIETGKRGGTAMVNWLIRFYKSKWRAERKAAR